MDIIHSSHSKYLTDIKAVWSRHQFGPSGNYHYITNNRSESFNAFIGDAREVPIIDLIDSIRQKIMTKLDARQRCGLRWKHILVPNALKNIQDARKMTNEFIIRRSDDMRAEVISPTHRFVADLIVKECTVTVEEYWGEMPLPPDPSSF
ncbi:hypothetical protein QJS10_CPA08g00695 [Acorus calamus]|uniref:Uncharacterized protein n=1 Tax=Acorus calamus TaxID=4465 RepID=A0AAV9E970_ACOCL|nr:hypothetical protein QJS10_CPA08g00695 [Acorus calamus]